MVSSRDMVSSKRFARMMVSGTVANPHAATSIGGTSLSYDNNGNLTVYGSDGYTWDYRNRLTQSTGSTTATYAYDHASQRVKKTSGGVTTIFPNKYLDITGATTTMYVMLPDGSPVATVALTQAAEATTTTYIHPDHLGSTNVTTNESGELVQTLDYYPYGAKRIEYGTDVSQREFIGQHFDEESDLSYLNARYYEGSRGQFLSQDPVFWEVGQSNDGWTVLRMPQLQNSYSYAGNNPIKDKDPQGRIIDTIADLGFIAYDLYRVGDAYFNGGDVRAEIGYLGLDIAGAAIPGATGFGVAGRITNTANQVTRGVNVTQNVAPGLQQAMQNIKPVEAAYSRPAGMTTQAQRAAVNAPGSVCVSCGQTGVKMFADHKTPLVVEHYTTGKIDVQAARSTAAVQPQCASCSAKQGGILSGFSKAVKSALGLK